MLRIFAVAGDLASAEGIDAVIAGVRAGTEQVDILYNNAGIGSGSKRIFDFEQSEWGACVAGEFVCDGGFV